MPQINGVNVTPAQADIYALVARFDSGVTDNVLVHVAQAEMKTVYSESGIRSRRAELARRGLLAEVGQVKMRSGRKARRWAAV